MAAPPIDLDPEQSPDQILANAINRNTDLRASRIKRNIIVAVLVVCGLLGYQQWTIQKQSDLIERQGVLLSRRSTTVNFLGCFADYLLGLVDNQPPRSEAEQSYIDATRKGLDRARAADLAEDQNIPRCTPPPRPGG